MRALGLNDMARLLLLPRRHMKAFEKILVPVDFSAHSAEAIRTAADVAARYGGAITLVHVYDPLVYAVPEGYLLLSTEQLGRLMAALKSQLSEAARVAEDAGAVHVKTQLLQGFAAGEITTFATHMGADLIVMGTHGRSGSQHVVLGSVAERVLRTAPCPVLTVKAPRIEGNPAPG